MKDKMPTEVTDTRVPRGLLGAILAVVTGGVVEGAMVSDGQPWWYGPLAVAVVAVVWWAIYAVLVVWQETEDDDGNKNDRGSRIARTLRRAWTRQKISQVQPEPDEGEETKE